MLTSQETWLSPLQWSRSQTNPKQIVRDQNHWTRQKCSGLVQKRSGFFPNVFSILLSKIRTPKVSELVAFRRTPENL
jgi:hypothetical protein